jgi:hypothetical protein
MPNKILHKLNIMKTVKRAMPWRSRNIHRLSKSATTFKQRKYQIEKIRSSTPYLKKELSLGLDDRILNQYMTKTELSHSQFQVLRKLFGLSAYATRLAGKGNLP